MTENATFISQLAPDQPGGLEDYSTADDHIRMLKLVLRTQFPGFTTTEAVLASIAQMNLLVGKTPAIPSIESGVFTATLSNVVGGNLSFTMHWTRIDNVVFLTNQNTASGESSSANCSISTLPLAIRPEIDKHIMVPAIQGAPPTNTQRSPTLVTIQTNGFMSFQPPDVNGQFTGGLYLGIHKGLFAGTTFQYTISG